MEDMQTNDFVGCFVVGVGTKEEGEVGCFPELWLDTVFVIQNCPLVRKKQMLVYLLKHL